MIVLTPPTQAELHKHHRDELDLPAEARALYVAMTRARQDLYHVAPPELPLFRRAGVDVTAVATSDRGGRTTDTASSPRRAM